LVAKVDKGIDSRTQRGDPETGAKRPEKLLNTGEKTNMLSIQTNVAALYGQQNLAVNSNFQQTTINRLTSGYRINSSADDAAGLAIANALRSQRTELTQGIRNANDGISQLQIIDGGLNNVSQILDRLKTLATQAASGTFTGDFTTVNSEFTKDLAEIDRQAANIGLGSAANSDFQTDLSVYLGGGLGTNNGGVIGTASETISLSGSAVDSTGLSLNGTTIGDTTSAQAAITAIAAAVVSLGKVQGVVGAGINQLNFAIGLAQSQVTNYAADESRIRDADIATEAANLSKAQVLMQSSMAALAQANSIPQSVLKLLQ
jgi:flagellin